MNREDWDARYSGTALAWSRDPNVYVREELAELEPARALDVGCGEGRNAIWLASRGWQVRAIDFSKVGIDRARGLARERGIDVDWVVGDITTTPLGGPHDLAIAIYLHSTAEVRARWLARVCAALRTGGTLLYVGHDSSNLARGHGGPQSPEVLCTPEEIVQALCGFRIDEAQVVERAVHTDPGHGGGSNGKAIARDAVVRAVKLAASA